MSNSTTRRLKQLHIEMKTLKNKESGGAKLSHGEQTRLDQLVSEYHEALTDALFHTY
jgi:hypothetical protein